MNAIKMILGWGIAVVLAVAIGSVIQTQFNLAEISALGAGIGMKARMATTWHDLLSFTPLYAILVALAFAVAWPVAGWLKRWLPGHRPLLFTLAGFSAIWVMIAVMNRSLPITAIGATRELDGTVLLAAAGAFAGWVYTRIVKDR